MRWLLGLAVLALVPLAVANKPQPPASLEFLCWGTCEAPVPGFVYTVQGCGYRVGVPVRVYDNATYRAVIADGIIPFPLPEELRITVNFEVPVDASGCVSFRYQAWGNGAHFFEAKQRLQQRRLTLMATLWEDIHVHNRGEILSDRTCLYFAPPPNGPLQGHVCPNTDAPWPLPDPWVDFTEEWLGTDPGSNCAATSIQNDEAPPDKWVLDQNDDRVHTAEDAAFFAAYVGNPSFFGDADYVTRYDVTVDGRIDDNDINWSGNAPC